MHDAWMWSLLLVSAILPPTALAAGKGLTDQSLATIVASPLFWLPPIVSLAATGFRPELPRRR